MNIGSLRNDGTSFLANKMFPVGKVEEKEELSTKPDDFIKIFQEKQIKANTSPSNTGAPYSFLANDRGEINYNGTTFICDDFKKALCLGNMNNEKDILTIPLSGGGTLRVNRDNFDDLSKAISMFSAEDQGRIMRAIATDAKARSVKKEVEDEKNTVCDLGSKKTSESQEKV